MYVHRRDACGTNKRVNKKRSARGTSYSSKVRVGRRDAEPYDGFSMVKLCKTSQNGGIRPTTGVNRLTISGYSRFKGYRGRRFIPIEVLKMLSPRRSGSDGAGSSKAGNGTMPGNRVEDESGTQEFLSTGRTGRRNALPDILGRHAATGISDLSDRFGELSTEADCGKNPGEREPGQLSTSKQHVG